MRKKLIKHGYPKQMIRNWDNEYCKNKWNELKRFLADHNIKLN